MTIIRAGIAKEATMTDTAMHEARQAETGAPGKIAVWDPLVRLFHWSLVAAFAVAWLTADELSTVHEIAGYVVAGLVAFRVFWGLIGGRYARFAQFLKGPGATISYLGDMTRGRERRYLGHNPAGAAMIVALLVTLAGTAFTGWLIQEPERAAMLPVMPQIVASAHADEAGRGDHHDEDALEEVHEVLANLTLVLVVLHVAGVGLASFRHRENLARAMVSGMKREPGPDDIA